ncbi:MAG: Chromosome segregation ATPases [uncultured Paraburkholderia sp.]|uniref:DNA-binding protein n=1 Tax=uncultured Paraburkholderia sp. TaxID=1822466 RepID=UPI002598BEC8|nr:DNA-binding protein [uncultured Paraburkholderia sp.]CAH2901986.1 MAG: Chromosome segregation ATPases [uncultured Paraburkholderia sp.]CAH2936012.1 MAG: Chromosome segregation ATPases [uncultured Paraburkholderia sp.]
MNVDDERQAIREELDAMRSRGSRRQELSLHACKRLFFDLGIRPSMAAVRDLTQTGSASDIPKDIDHFWERIRNVSRVKVGAGAIPKALEERAGELLGALFEEAVAHARTTLDAEREESRSRIAAAEQRAREAEIRRDASEDAIKRSEQRAEAAWERVRALEAELSTVTTHGTAHHESLQTTVRRLERENETLRQRLDTEQATNATLRDRIDALHVELRQSTEHYAQQIKDAVAEAERRVKPMLVELDSLRSMAATYQSGVRDASRKEFEFIQQLAAAKARGDRLDAQLREQSDEVDALTKELAALRGQQGIDPEIGSLLCSLVEGGRLSSDELRTIGTAADGHVRLPLRCPKCDEGEPELSQVDHRFELQCPECEHSSGLGDSRLEAVSRFLSSNSLSAQA